MAAAAPPLWAHQVGLKPMTEARQTRAANYAIKREHGFKCAQCGAPDGVLAVTEKATGQATTRCERCLDKRSHEPRPNQFLQAREEQERQKANRR